MKAYTINKTDKTITVGLENINMTMVAPLLKSLNDDSNVVVARFIDQHPELQDRRLFIEVKKGDAADAFKKAAKAVSDYYSKIKE